MAQLVEQRIRNAWVGGSSPPIGSTLIKFLPFLVQRIIAVIAQLVEHWLPKPRVAGSSPVYRSEKDGVSKSTHHLPLLSNFYEKPAFPHFAAGHITQSVFVAKRAIFGSRIVVCRI